ncbi:Crp/Fnr family transcriptional regulator [Robbsia sp. Bb-Pol-6]|uniref:Crp/Fnr family transcriptional regulator n=1 Tax=Robbsia betulipollinis TaxID=2981849 RepID=A0ABT3ZJ05_9BURK|nr:Crp/Fnr family transcriptional regulator [Robbsia betulipollinis]MCY0386485.1 Crp/Fnr family transcriptional regulator [Robbsia betulipollinis]
MPFEKSPHPAARELLTEQAQDALAGISELVRLPAHQVLYRQGESADCVYNIVGGAVLTYELLANGNRHITAFLFPNDLLGLSTHGAYIATAETLSPVVAYRIPIDALRDTLTHDPTLSVGLVLKLCHDLRDAQHHAITLAENAAHARVAGFLLWLRDALKSPADPLCLPMARQDIADYLGLSVESISRALHLLESEAAILRVGPRQIRLLDLDKLASFSGLDA